MVSLLESVRAHLCESGFVSSNVFRICPIMEVNIYVHRDWSLLPVLEAFRSGWQLHFLEIKRNDFISAYTFFFFKSNINYSFNPSK